MLDSIGLECLQNFEIPERSFSISSLFLKKGAPEDLSGALEKIKSIINCKLTEEGQNDQCKKYSVFEDLQDGSKQTFVAIVVYDLAI